MAINTEKYYQALLARDDRFDGVFFAAVTTTGIYCRPVCPARKPRRDRCRFFPSAAAAERDGFRPCLRCRPELAPGNAPVDASARIAHAAAARIEAGALNDGGSVEHLAAELGVGTRHVRRLVRSELGVSPVELAQTHRLLLAKQLLADTRLPTVEVALASGFGSLRRFNALFRSHYNLTPTEMRRSPKRKTDSSTLRLKLSYRPPFAWEPMLQFLSARSTAGVECVTENLYSRTIAEAGRRGWVSVAQAKNAHHLNVELSLSLVPVLANVLCRLKNLFDLKVCPDVIDGHLAGDKRLAAGVKRCPGLRVPGAVDGFELAVRAILGQQISVRAATTLAGRLATAFGEPIETPFPELSRISPRADVVAGLTVDQLTSLGITKSRSRSILGMARSVDSGALTLEPATDPEGVIRRLLELTGIGEWTAHYIAMRALRWPDAFPHADLGLRKALGGITPRELLNSSPAWSPWRAYAAMHLWRES